MTTTTMPQNGAELETPLTAGQLAWIFTKHLTALYIPGITLLFLLTGPHTWYTALLFMVPMALAHQLDCSPRLERRQPRESVPAWPFDVIVYALVAIQGLVIWEMVQLFRVQDFFSFDMLMVNLIVGSSSGFSIITAHELIHRKSKVEQGIGRLLLASTLYEHFYTEHLRGHHSKVGTPDDPATALFGQGYENFFWRTVPAQFKSAWRLEKRRLGDVDMKLSDPRMLKNRVVHGIVLEWGIAFSIYAAFGFVPFFAFVLQGFTAIRLLEAVNYFEHWGLQRAQTRVRPMDSWDTHSWFTYYGLTGLSRHADHHAYPTRPYQRLRVWEEAPLLPHGYVGTVDLVMSNNSEFQRVAAMELGRSRLGPFRPPIGEVEADAAPPEPMTPEASLAKLEEVHADAAWKAANKKGVFAKLGRGWMSLPAMLRYGLIASAVLLVLTTGIQWESPGEFHFVSRLLLNVWILGLFLGVMPFRQRIETRIGNETVAWAIAFSLLFVVGYGTDLLLL